MEPAAPPYTSTRWGIDIHLHLLVRLPSQVLKEYVDQEILNGIKSASGLKGMVLITCGFVFQFTDARNGVDAAFNEYV